MLDTGQIKEGTMILMVGAPASGKSTWANKHFLPTQILSSDKIRAMLTDDENNQECSGQAFQILNQIALQRMRWGKTTVIDATNTTVSQRAPFVAAARNYNKNVVAVVMTTPRNECYIRDNSRDRTVGIGIVDRFYDRLDDAIEVLKNGEVDAIYFVDADGVTDDHL